MPIPGPSHIRWRIGHYYRKAYLATRPDQLRGAVAANPLNTQLHPGTPTPADGPPPG